MEKIKKLIKKNWDEIGIAAALGHFSMTGTKIDYDQYGYVIEALKRSRKDLHDADLEELHAYVQSLDESQIPGLVSNIKGIAHEVYFVEAENTDGDEVKAYLFEDTNHKGYDVVLYDEEGNYTYLQLKATDSPSYVHEAVQEIGRENIVVTEELAEKMDLPSSGISNAQLEYDVETVVNRLLEDRHLWEYVPTLSTWSIALIAASLTKRYIKGELPRKQYIQYMTVYCGAKLSKILIIIAAMSIPGVNIVTGALLFLKTVYNFINTFNA